MYSDCFAFKVFLTEKFHIDKAKIGLCVVCLSVAIHISETSETIAIKFEHGDCLSHEKASRINV